MTHQQRQSNERWEAGGGHGRGWWRHDNKGDTAVPSAHPHRLHTDSSSSIHVHILHLGLPKEETSSIVYMKPFQELSMVS